MFDRFDAKSGPKPLFGLTVDLNPAFAERLGYAVTFINDVELQHARTAAKAIETEAIDDEPTMNPDNTFAEADKNARRLSKNRDTCRAALNRLLDSSPVSLYQTQRP